MIVMKVSPSGCQTSWCLSFTEKPVVEQAMRLCAELLGFRKVGGNDRITVVDDSMKKRLFWHEMRRFALYGVYQVYRFNKTS